MALFSKLKWIFGILIIFILVLATNLIDRKNFVRVRDAVVTIYEDRIVANDLLVEMSRLLYKKEVAFFKSDVAFFTSQNKPINNEFQVFLDKFEQTQLTEYELLVFKGLKDHFIELKKVETNETFEKQSGKLETQLAKVHESIYKLSKIQKEEGSRQKQISESAIDSIELFTQMEIYLLVILALIVQIIILTKTKEPKFDDSDDLEF